MKIYKHLIALAIALTAGFSLTAQTKVHIKDSDKYELTWATAHPEPATEQPKDQ